MKANYAHVTFPRVHTHEQTEREEQKIVKLPSLKFRIDDLYFRKILFILIVILINLHKGVNV